MLLALATAALPTTLVVWLVHPSSVAAAPPATSVAWVMQLCYGMLLALLTDQTPCPPMNF